MAMDRQRLGGRRYRESTQESAEQAEGIFDLYGPGASGSGAGAAAGSGSGSADGTGAGAYRDSIASVDDEAAIRSLPNDVAGPQQRASTRSSIGPGLPYMVDGPLEAADDPRECGSVSSEYSQHQSQNQSQSQSHTSRKASYRLSAIPRRLDPGAPSGSDGRHHEDDGSNEQVETLTSPDAWAGPMEALSKRTSGMSLASTSSAANEDYSLPVRREVATASPRDSLGPPIASSTPQKGGRNTGDEEVISNSIGTGTGRAGSGTGARTPILTVTPDMTPSKSLSHSQPSSHPRNPHSRSRLSGSFSRSGEGRTSPGVEHHLNGSPGVNRRDHTQGQGQGDTSRLSTFSISTSTNGSPTPSPVPDRLLPRMSNGTAHTGNSGARSISSRHASTYVGEASISQASFAPSLGSVRYPGEEADAYHVRSTCEFL